MLSTTPRLAPDMLTPWLRSLRATPKARKAYAGDLRPFRDVLALGEPVHAGQSTVSGHGRYLVP